MSYKNSRDNLIANIAQQSVGLVLAIVVPLLLSVEEYAQITVISVLIAFLPLADLGMGIMYSRKLPALYNAQNFDIVDLWNVTFYRFKLYSSVVFAAGIAWYYFHRYQQILTSFLLFLVIVSTSIFSYAALNLTVQSNFRHIRTLNIIHSLAKLSTLPYVWIAGVKGWFLGHLFGVFAAFLSKQIRYVFLHGHATPDWKLVKTNLLQGIMFSLVATLWLQLTSSGKVYAAFAYPDEIVAQYGLVGSIYQIVIALSVAAFVPQTIKIYRLINESETVAIHYALKLAIYSAPFFMISGVVLTYISPLIIEAVFPRYNVDKALYAPLMLSLFNNSLMVTLGTLIIGFGKAKTYLIMIVMACVAYLSYVWLLPMSSGYHAAAIAQLLTLSTYSLTMLFLVFFTVKNKIENKNTLLISAIPSILAPIVYFLMAYS